jgi:hypothetical protein
MIATAVEAARAESMTLRQIALRIEEVHGQPLPCRLETLSVALRHEGFSYKRGRYSLKKSAMSRSSPRRQIRSQSCSRRLVMGRVA